MNIRKGSAWRAPQVRSFLHDNLLPVRIGCIGEAGTPLVVSVWYRFDGERLWCALHESAALLRYLTAAPACGFEVAGDGPPYFGVRGQAHVVVDRSRGGQVLELLLERYRIPADSKLATWLVSRSADEYAIALEPIWITAWDYRERMDDLERPQG